MAAAGRWAFARRSRESLRPVDGLTLTILDADDRLELDNRSGKPIVILGYQGEPYLAFRDGKVYRNSHSPATYLNDDRFGQVALPVTGEREGHAGLGGGRTARDLRLARPPHPLDEQVTAAEDRGDEGPGPARLRLDRSRQRSTTGRSRIAGSLDYQPPSGDTPMPLIIAAIVIIFAGIAAVVLRLMRERKSAVSAP